MGGGGHVPSVPPGIYAHGCDTKAKIYNVNPQTLEKKKTVTVGLE